MDKLQEPQTEEEGENAKREQLKVLRNEIKILSDLVGKKEKTSWEKLLADLRAQKLVLQMQIDRRHKKLLLSKDENSGMQISLRSGDDEHLSTRPVWSQISSDSKNSHSISKFHISNKANIFHYV